VTERAEIGKRRILIRVTAGILAVIMIAGVLLYTRTEIKVDPEPIVNKAVRLAAKQLLSDSGYAQASRLERMGEVARGLFSGRKGSEDYDLAAQIAAARGEYAEAAELTGKAIDLYEGGDQKAGELYLRMGYLRIMQQEYGEALKWLDLGIELNDSAEARLTRAQVLVNLGNPERALEDVSVYLNKAPNAENNLADLINVYEAAGDYETAVRFYTRLISATGNPEYYLNRAYCYTSLGRMDSAENDRERYGETGGPEIANADVMLGIGHMRQEAYEKAGDRFILALEENYSDPQSLYYYIVLCAYITRNYERVCAYGDQLIDRMNRGEATGNATVGMEKTTGKLKVTLAETDPASLCLMTGAAHVQLGDYDQAAASLTTCLQQNGKATYANYLRGSCLLAAEKYEEAMADFDAAIAAGEETEKSRYGRGVCRMQLGDTKGAMEDFDWVVLHGTDEELFTEASGLLSQLLNEGNMTKEKTQEDPVP
jgi:tetratricopeptide (TPR) repeat protein